MDPIVLLRRHDRADQAQSCRDAAAYVRKHLQSLKEAGCLPDYMGGYLMKGPRIRVRFLDPELWLQVGLTQEELDAGEVPILLLRNLMMGRDRHGNQLLPVRTAMPRGFTEILIPTAAEISHAIQDGRVDAEVYYDKVMDSVLDVFQMQPTRVCPGKKEQKNRTQYVPGRVLSFAVLHGENKASEPHVHPHTIVLPPVLMANGEWRSFAPRGFLMALHQQGGRARIGQAMREVLEDAKIIVEWQGGRAYEQVGAAFGPTLQFPDGTFQEAGQIAHQRGAQARALRELYRRAWDDLPASADLEALAGQASVRVRRKKSPIQQALCVVMTAARRVLREGSGGHLASVGVSAPWLDRLCARGQWWLRFAWPGPPGVAAAGVLQKIRDALAGLLDSSVQARHTLEGEGLGIQAVVETLAGMVRKPGAHTGASRALLFGLQRRGLVRPGAARSSHELTHAGQQLGRDPLGAVDLLRDPRSLVGCGPPVLGAPGVASGAADTGRVVSDPEGIRGGDRGSDAEGDGGAGRGTEKRSEPEGCRAPDGVSGNGPDDPRGPDFRERHRERLGTDASGGGAAGSSGPADESLGSGERPGRDPVEPFGHPGNAAIFSAASGAEGGTSGGHAGRGPAASDRGGRRVEESPRRQDGAQSDDLATQPHALHRQEGLDPGSTRPANPPGLSGGGHPGVQGRPKAGHPGAQGLDTLRPGGALGGAPGEPPALSDRVSPDHGRTDEGLRAVRGPASGSRRPQRPGTRPPRRPVVQPGGPGRRLGPQDDPWVVERQRHDRDARKRVAQEAERLRKAQAARAAPKADQRTVALPAAQVPPAARGRRFR